MFASGSANWIWRNHSHLWPLAHSFTKLLGYNPPTRWPQGRAGTRPDGSDFFSTGIEPWGRNGDETPPGLSHFYTYHMDMKASRDGKYWGSFFNPDAGGVLRHVALDREAVHIQAGVAAPADRFEVGDRLTVEPQGLLAVEIMLKCKHARAVRQLGGEPAENQPRVVRRHRPEHHLYRPGGAGEAQAVEMEPARRALFFGSAGSRYHPNRPLRGNLVVT